MTDDARAITTLHAPERGRGPMIRLDSAARFSAHPCVLLAQLNPRARWILVRGRTPAPWNDTCLSLGRDHGKSFLLSTHLLADVDRVCDRVVILHHGRVLLEGGVATLRARRQDRYRLQIEGNPQGFVRELDLEGVRLLHDNGRGVLRVAVPAGWVTRAFFALADNHGVVVRGLQADDEALEELFHRVIGEAQEK